MISGEKGDEAVANVKSISQGAMDEAKTRLRAASDRASPLLDDAKGHASEAFDQAKSGVDVGVRNLQAKAGDIAQQAGDYAKGAIDATKDKAQDLAGQLPSRDDIQAAARRGSKTIARQVARQPLEALLLAGAVGYLVAWMVHRR